MASQKFPSLHLSPYDAVFAVHHPAGGRGKNRSYPFKKIFKKSKTDKALNVLMKHHLHTNATLLIVAI